MFPVVKKKKIYVAYVSKDNSNPEKLFILLMISGGEKWEAKSKGQQQWHYLTVKKLSAFKRKFHQIIMTIFIV